MKYVNAKNVLPDFLVKMLQNYIQGAYIYVPSDNSSHKKWGEVSGYRRELDLRNIQIKDDYIKGLSAEQLSDKYHLSVYAIRKLIYHK